MPLPPKAIYNDLKNKDFDKVSTFELILTLIDNTENLKIRLDSIDVFEKSKLKNKRVFKVLENLFKF